MAGDLRAALDNSVAQDVPGAAEDIEERIEEAERNMAPVPQMTQEAMSEDDMRSRGSATDHKSYSLKRTSEHRFTGTEHTWVTHLPQNKWQKSTP